MDFSVSITLSLGCFIMIFLIFLGSDVVVDCRIISSGPAPTVSAYHKCARH